MKHVATQLVSNHPNGIQKPNRIRVAKDILLRINSEPTFMKRIVAGDETWAYEFNIQISIQA